MLDKKFLSKVTKTFGVVYQREMIIEECSEFIIAMQDINTVQGRGDYLIGKNGIGIVNIKNEIVKNAVLNYAEEFVDVEIVLTELKTALDGKIYNKILKSKQVQGFKKSTQSNSEWMIRDVMITKCCDLIKSIQKVKRLEQKIGFVDDYKNKSNADAKKSTNNYIEKLVYVEVILNLLRKSIDINFYNKSLKFKLARLKKRLADKEKENKKIRVPIGRPKSVSKNWDEHITIKLKSNKRKNNVVKP